MGRGGLGRMGRYKGWDEGRIKNGGRVYELWYAFNKVASWKITANIKAPICDENQPYVRCFSHGKGAYKTFGHVW